MITWPIFVAMLLASLAVYFKVKSENKKEEQQKKEQEEKEKYK